MIGTEDPNQSNDRLVIDMERVHTSSGRNSPERTRSPKFGENNNYADHLYYQDAQDPNEDDDSEMSFGSITSHNLDT